MKAQPASVPVSPSASVPSPFSSDAENFGSAVGETVKSVAELSLPFPALAQLQSEYVRRATELWNETLQRMRSEEAGGPLPDRRFASPEWARNPTAAFMAQMYLLNAQTLLCMADALEGDEKTRQRIRFAVQQWVDAASPSNYLALNPEVQRKALDTKGESLKQGLEHLWRDVQQGHVSQTDETVFEVGRNVAATKGSVVYENELFQLIEYAPLTGKVYERPLLMVPPCINKFYILDLQPENSLVRWAVEQGHRTFMVSWRNADENVAAKTWDDYVGDGVIRAMQVARQIAGSDTLDTLGFCIGGTLLATALAVLAARGEHPAQSMTLLTTFLDFTNTGVLDLFIDEAAVQVREITIGNQAPNGPGLLKGSELAATFSFLRPNELVWNYVVGNYLKGETPPPFDMLYWNSDGANLPGPFFCWYLRNTYLENNLKAPGRLTVCGEKVDLGRIDVPAYLFASREDHIVPWESAYLSTHLLKGPKRFVLGASGHIAGVVNPPARRKRSYWTNDTLAPQATQWQAKAKEHPGSWWTDWADWLKGHAGKLVPAPKSQGSRTYKPIEPAPGRYVKVKA